jgi:hypothetical protein
MFNNEFLFLLKSTIISSTEFCEIYGRIRTCENVMRIHPNQLNVSPTLIHIADLFFRSQKPKIIKVIL